MPSSIAEVSSAYCDILNSMLLILMPFIVLFSLSLLQGIQHKSQKGMREGVALTASTLYVKKKQTDVQIQILLMIYFYSILLPIS